MVEMLKFRVAPLSVPPETLSFQVSHLVIAGWVGRDGAELQHHIDELGALGIAPPSSTPLFYAVAPELLTQVDHLRILGSHSSGEVEPLLVLTDTGMLVGVGSDHTDRHAEVWSVPHSKQLCAKPVASELWRFTDVEPHWDKLVLRSWISAKADGEWVLYQEGTVAGLRRPEELAQLAGGLRPGSAMLCGTLAAIGGIRPASRFRMELFDAVLGRSIRHEYRVTCLPVVV